jgi:hypothetical protein
MEKYSDIYNFVISVCRWDLKRYPLIKANLVDTYVHIEYSNNHSQKNCYVKLHKTKCRPGDLVEIEGIIYNIDTIDDSTAYSNFSFDNIILNPI